MSREVQQLDILFKDPNATYRAGDVVAGSVLLVLGQEMKVKGIKLGLHGIARVQWDEKRTYTKGSASKLSHKNMDVYLDEIVIIIGRTENLNPGRYNWPFTLRLPPYLPAGYEGQYGRVQYWTKVVLERPWKGDIDLTKNFTVLGNLDLNTDPDAKKPVEALGDIMTGMCCKTGPISGQIYVERRGFCAGQNIPFQAKVENHSKKKINIRVVLSQVAVFRADKQVRKTTNLLKGLTKGEINPGETVEWEEEIKNIPSVPPTRLGGGCKHIEVKYILTLVACPSGVGRDLDVPVEIIIGTIPLRKMEVPASSGSSGSPKGLKLTVKAAARRQSEYVE